MCTEVPNLIVNVDAPLALGVDTDAFGTEGSDHLSLMCPLTFEHTVFSIMASIGCQRHPEFIAILMNSCLHVTDPGISIKLFSL